MTILGDDRLVVGRCRSTFKLSRRQGGCHGLQNYQASRQLGALYNLLSSTTMQRKHATHWANLDGRWGQVLACVGPISTASCTCPSSNTSAALVPLASHGVLACTFVVHFLLLRNRGGNTRRMWPRRRTCKWATGEGWAFTTTFWPHV